LKETIRRRASTWTAGGELSCETVIHDAVTRMKILSNVSGGLEACGRIILVTGTTPRVADFAHKEPQSRPDGPHQTSRRLLKVGRDRHHCLRRRRLFSCSIDSAVHVWTTRNVRLV